MKKILLLIGTILSLNSCSSSFNIYKIPLKNKYEIVDTYQTEKTKEEAWNNIVEVFAKNGLGIKIIDKSSGLIVSEVSTFQNYHKESGVVSYENKNGFLVNTDAYIVCSKYEYRSSDILADLVTGYWNVRIFEKDGKVFVNTNLTNIKASNLFDPNNSQYLFTCKSTGVFEKNIFNMVNK